MKPLTETEKKLNIRKHHKSYARMPGKQKWQKKSGEQIGHTNFPLTLRSTEEQGRPVSQIRLQEMHRMCLFPNTSRMFRIYRKKSLETNIPYKPNKRILKQISIRGQQLVSPPTWQT